MVEALVSGVFENVVVRAGGLFVEEVKLLNRVNREVEEIKDMQKQIQGFLKDLDAYASARYGTALGQEYVGQSKHLAYKMEEVLETFDILVVSRREGRGIADILRRYDCIFSEGVSAHKVGSEIATLKARLTNITKSLNAYGIKGIIGRARVDQILIRSSDSYLKEEDFVGMEKDEEQLVLHLVSMEKGYEVISITGMGGQGKTAIAMRVYNSIDVRRNFEGFAWVCVTKQCKTQSIWQDILRQLLPESNANVMQMTETELVKQLYKVQQEKKCLVVIDDIWSTNDWESLKLAFPIGGTVGSKILFTTRKFDLAKIGLVHELGFLNEDDGWELLQKKVFPTQFNQIGHGEKNAEMEKLGKAMIRHCYGLPLAIVSLAAVLISKEQDLHCWKMVLEEMERSGLKGEITHVQESLAISYYDLPYELKSCFRYLGSLPNGHEIEVEKLFQLWMAESMISSEQSIKEEETMIEVGERYLKEFEERCMVQVQVQVDESTGRVKSCRLHRHFRELCLRMETEEGFLRVIDLQSSRVDDSASRGTSFSTREVRRLSIFLGDLGDLDNYVPPRRRVARHLRNVSFFLQNYFPRSKLSRIVESHLSDFKLVRILDLGGLIFSKLDEAIGKLIYLKYLGLRYTVFHELPSTIGNMLHLQTLDLWDDNTRYAGIFVPKELGKLKSLKYLYLRSPVRSNELKMRLGELSQLEILENFDSEAFEAKDLVKLTNLRKFGAKISKKSDLKTITGYLQSDSSDQLKHFTLSIKYCDLYSEEGLGLLTEVFVCRKLYEFSLNGRTGMLPEYSKNFSACLAKLTLESCELRDDPMPTLEKLPNLRSLYLKWNAFIGEEIVCSQTGFPQLRILQFWRIRRLTNWSVEKGAMGKLSSLDIGSCPDLKMLPDGLQFVTTLQQLVIRWMPQAFTNRLRVLEDGSDGEDFYKVAHVLPIKITHYDGKEEVVSSSSSNIVPKKMDPIAKKTTKAERMVKQHATPKVGVVIREPTFPSSSTTTRSNTKQEYVANGKAPITEASSESSEDDE